MTLPRYTMKKCLEALLLLGPTGAGKTPLGERLEAGGLGGHRCRNGGDFVLIKAPS
jgi:hypothetical protein